MTWRGPLRWWTRGGGTARRSRCVTPAALLALFLRRIDPAADWPSLLDEIGADRIGDQRRREQLEYAARKAAASEPTLAWHAARGQLGL